MNAVPRPVHLTFRCRDRFPTYGEIPRQGGERKVTMKAPRNGTSPGWWNRFQQVVAALVALSGEVAKIADNLRRMFG